MSTQAVVIECAGEQQRVELLRWLSENGVQARTRDEEVEALRRQIVGHCDRIARQAELLARRAER